MESSLIRRLETVEDEMFAAVASTSTAFAEKWTTLQQDINHALQAGLLSCETQSLAFQTASMIRTIAESFLKVEQEHIALSVKLQDDVQDIYAQVCTITWLV